MKTAVSLIYYILSLQALAVIQDVVATDIRWTAANDDGKDNPAAAAPKSQKYWDENNIERPDYAKTDAEVMVEAMNNDGTTTAVGRNWMKIAYYFAVLIAIGGSIGYFYVWPRVLRGRGHTLGSSSSSGLFSELARVIGGALSKPSDPSLTTRQARLSRFEKLEEKQS